MSKITCLRVIGFWLCCQYAFGENLQIKVIDDAMQPVEYAVVYINEHLGVTGDQAITVDQVDKEFIPYVTAIQRGNSINFPNNDDIRHQVYSFSKTKAFEIPLYSGNPLRPVLFDNTGAVAMACNIHDWMSAYVYVVDTDKFAVTDANGGALMTNLADGDYEVLVWHPRLKGDVMATAQKVTIAGHGQSIAFTVEQKPVLRAWRAPKSVSRRGY